MLHTLFFQQSIIVSLTLPWYLHARKFNSCPSLPCLPPQHHYLWEHAHLAQWKPSKPWFNDWKRNAVNWQPTVLARSWLTVVHFSKKSPVSDWSNGRAACGEQAQTGRQEVQEFCQWSGLSERGQFAYFFNSTLNFWFLCTQVQGNLGKLFYILDKANFPPVCRYYFVNRDESICCWVKKSVKQLKSSGAKPLYCQPAWPTFSSQQRF